MYWKLCAKQNVVWVKFYHLVSSLINQHWIVFHLN